jgi:hypothetical protein
MTEFASAAYKYVAIVAMVAEINYCSDRLNLPIKHPLEDSDITGAMVFEPKGLIGFSGSLSTADYTFSFAQSGRLHVIERLHFWDGEPQLQREEELAKIKAIIDTNQAYNIARRDLSAIEINVDQLERDTPVAVKQRKFYVSHDDQTHPILLPLFDVKWGNWDTPVVKIVIAGNTGDVLTMWLLNESYSGRPHDLLRNTNVLLAIPDEEFLHYNGQQRSNLLSRFLAVKYPSPEHLFARPILPYVNPNPTNQAIHQNSNGVLRPH